MQRRISFFLFILNSPKLMHSSHFSSCQNETTTYDVKGNEENMLKKEKENEKQTTREIQTKKRNDSDKRITQQSTLVSRHTRKKKNKQTEERETVKLIDNSYRTTRICHAEIEPPLPKQPRLKQPTQSESISPPSRSFRTDRILI